MTVSYFYLLLILAISLVELIGGKEIFSNFDIRTILLWILIILANGIISICSRLDDLKRKWEICQWFLFVERLQKEQRNHVNIVNTSIYGELVQGFVHYTKKIFQHGIIANITKGIERLIQKTENANFQRMNIIRRETNERIYKFF